MPRSDTVHPHTVGRPLLGQAFGEPHHAGLGGVVGRAARPGPERREPGDVDNAALPPLQEVGTEGAASLEGFGEIHVHYVVPLGFAHPRRSATRRRDQGLRYGVSDTVDQHVQMAELPKDLDGQPVHIGALRRVTREGQPATPRQPDLFSDLARPNRGQPRDGHVRAGIGKGQGDALADASARPDTQHLLPLDVELRYAHLVTSGTTL